MGLSAGAISNSLRRELGLDTGEIAAALAYPITPPDGIAVTAITTADFDLTDHIDVRDPRAEGVRRWAGALLAASESPDPAV